MTEHLTDAQIAEWRALAENAMADDWPNGRRKPFSESVADFAKFYAAARDTYVPVLRALQEHRKALLAVRRRVVVDHYTGSSPDSPHFWSCRLCTWIWKHGEPELHEPTCPLAAAPEPGSVAP